MIFSFFSVFASLYLSWVRRKRKVFDIFSGFSTCFLLNFGFLKLLFYWIAKKGFRKKFVLLGIREKLFIASNICRTVWIFDWKMYEKMKIGKPSRKTAAKKGIHVIFVVLSDIFNVKADRRPPSSAKSWMRAAAQLQKSILRLINDQKRSKLSS